MDFFGHQDAARRKSIVLIAYFIGAVILIIAAIYAAATLIFSYLQTQSIGEPGVPATLWNPEVFGWVVVISLAVILGGSLFKMAGLRGGGRVVAESLGATLVNPGTRDPDERRLLNVVEEMSIASGMAVPPVYLLRDEAGINAFAAGYSPNDAVVAVTRGTLKTLSRDELQGVMAHEFSHILNGDMRLNIRLMGVLHGILLIGLLGRGVFRSARFSGRSRSGSRGGGAPIILLALALLIIGYIGVFFGNLIKAAVSRQREFLADAAAVQFTRNPTGIAGALRKIGGLSAGSGLQAPRAEQASHLFFADGLAAPFMRLLATHPPLNERIRRIDPSWDGVYPPVQIETTPSSVQGKDETAAFAVASGARPAKSVPGDARSFRLAPEEAVARAGMPTAAHMAYARDLVSELPPVVNQAAREPFGARAVAYGLLLSRDKEVRQRQVARLKAHADPGVLKELQRIYKPVAGLLPQARLPLLDISLPALRALSDRQYQAFRENLDHLTMADREISPFELALRHMFRRHLDPQFLGARTVVAQYYALHRLAPECALLLSALARVGHTRPVEVAEAFQAGLAYLKIKQKPSLVPATETGLAAVDRVLDKLVQVSPRLKRQLIAACTATVARDGRVTMEEAEILRALSDSLEVPMPPFVAGESPRAGAVSGDAEGH